MKKQSIIIHYKQPIEITEEELRLAIQRGAIEVDEYGDVRFVDITDELITEAYDHTEQERCKVEYCWFDAEDTSFGDSWEVEW